jgi:AraC-like DNA-binding protein
MSRLDRVDGWIVLAAKANYNPRKLATACEISLSQLDRYFRCRFSQPPGDWLREQRLQKALALLRNSSAPIKSIAFELGYNDPSQFCHDFKRRFKYSPLKFIAKSQRTKNHTVERPFQPKQPCAKSKF